MQLNGKLVTLAGCDAPETLDAITSVLPIDAFIDEPLHHMSPSPGIELHPAGAEVHAAAKAAVGKHSTIQFAPLERFAFYETARKVRCFYCWRLEALTRAPLAQFKRSSPLLPGLRCGANGRASPIRLLPAAKGRGRYATLS